MSGEAAREASGLAPWAVRSRGGVRVCGEAGRVSQTAPPSPVKASTVLSLSLARSCSLSLALFLALSRAPLSPEPRVVQRSAGVTRGVAGAGGAWAAESRGLRHLRTRRPPGLTPDRHSWHPPTQ
eukprot:532562-Rhodomonas_salina.1